MRHATKLALAAAALVFAGTASVAVAQAGLSYQRAGVGLGIKPYSDASLSPEVAFGGEPAYAWQAQRPDYGLYGGVRELPHLGLRSAEAYGGIAYPLSGAWGSTFEAGVVQESWLAPRRYALSGQIHTTLASGRGLSAGLKYRLFDPDVRLRSGTSSEIFMNGYTLAPRVPGTPIGPSYQLQMSYQHSATSAFGLALGRDLETFTPLSELQSSGLLQFSFTGQHWLTPSWALSYDVLSTDLASPIRLQSLRLGVRYRF
jgi:hypothetical protein